MFGMAVLYEHSFNEMSQVSRMAFYIPNEYEGENLCIDTSSIIYQTLFRTIDS